MLFAPSLLVEWISQHHSAISTQSHGEAPRVHRLSITKDGSFRDTPHSTVEANLKTHINDTAFLLLKTK